MPRNKVFEVQVRARRGYYEFSEKDMEKLQGFKQVDVSLKRNAKYFGKVSDPKLNYSFYYYEIYSLVLDPGS